MKKKITIANAVTASRILFAIMVMFCEAFSMQFYIVYLFGAVTDMIDGTIARRTNTRSAFGSILDTVADCIFVVAVGTTILSAFYVPVWLWVWIAFIALIKIINLISSLCRYKKLVPMHTLMNKITGMMMFLFPFGIGKGAWQASAIAVVVMGCVATFAAIQEGHYIRTGKTME